MEAVHESLDKWLVFNLSILTIIAKLKSPPNKFASAVRDWQRQIIRAREKFS